MHVQINDILTLGKYKYYRELMKLCAMLDHYFV